MDRACSTSGGEEEEKKKKNACREVRRKETTRNTHKWNNNIKMDLRVMGWSGMDWINLAEDRDRWRALVNTVMYHRVP
jgi:hypothetical protein